LYISQVIKTNKFDNKKMFAVVKTGGKQYKIKENDIILVEKLSGKEGTSINLNEILLISNEKETKIGTPLLKGFDVKAKVLEQKKSKKIIVFKKKRRKNYKKKSGHRQNLTAIKIIKISTKSSSKKN
tara:strand:+ start:339 stop:719 length:381 start_codon:yes stop_codon:yes gene_type:complete